MTPYELGLHIREYNDKAKQDQEEKLVVAYLGAYWNRVKKMPSLKKILGTEQPKKEQTQEEMLAEIKKLNAELGGSTY